jgi:hypothetical protein
MRPDHDHMRCSPAYRPIASVTMVIHPGTKYDSTGWALMSDESQPDWRAWSQEAARLMQERNDAWMREYGLRGCHYEWSLDTAQLVFSSAGSEVVADVCVLGSVSRSEGTYLWAWANDTIPPHARRGLEKVREFGERNALDLLTTPERPGDRDDGMEMAAVAARVLDAVGVWVETTGDVTLFFALSCFRKRGDQH